MNRIVKLIAFLAGCQVLWIWITTPGSVSQRTESTFQWMFGGNRIVVVNQADVPSTNVIYFNKPAILVESNISKESAAATIQQLRKYRINAKLKQFQNGYAVYVDSGRNYRELQKILGRVKARGFQRARIIRN